MLLLLGIMTIVLVDLGIKSAIEEAEPSEFPKELKGSKGLIMLYRNHNDGFPMGVFRDRPDLVKNVPMAVLSAVAGIFFWLFPKKGYWAEKAGTCLVLGGGLSNLYDRMKRGYVVDYFSIHFKGLKKVVFNLGDICIFLGAGILLVSQIVESVREH